MSRSYKKSPICTDRRNGAKYWKRCANKRIRRNQDIPNGRKYKRYYETWEIHDYKFRWTEKEARNYYYYYLNDPAHPAFARDYLSKFKDEKDYLDKAWTKWYRRK